MQLAIRRQHAAVPLVQILIGVKKKKEEHKMKVNELQREIKSLESQAAEKE